MRYTYLCLVKSSPREVSELARIEPGSPLTRKLEQLWVLLRSPVRCHPQHVIKFHVVVTNTLDYFDVRVRERSMRNTGPRKICACQVADRVQNGTNIAVWVWHEVAIVPNRVSRKEDKIRFRVRCCSVAKRSFHEFKGGIASKLRAGTG
jgi:hypothetical protein